MKRKSGKIFKDKSRIFPASCSARNREERDSSYEVNGKIQRGLKKEFRDARGSDSV